MLDRKVKIVTDSASDLYDLGDFPFASAPLCIMTDEKTYVDNDDLSVVGMVEDLEAYSGRSRTSCPNLGDWLAAFGDADEVYCITITSGLSGSYNSACIAAKQYEEDHPGRRVLVVDSRSTGSEMVLLAEKIRDLLLEGRTFDEISAEMATYAHKETALLFILESMRNLANNGRVSPLVAKFAGMIGIRALGRASDMGTLEMLDKCRGTQRAIQTLYERMKSFGYVGGRVRIATCFNPDAANKLVAMIKRDFPEADIALRGCRGLCSFYAERGGILVGFEKTAD